MPEKKRHEDDGKGVLSMVAGHWAYRARRAVLRERYAIAWHFSCSQLQSGSKKMSRTLTVMGRDNTTPRGP